MSAGPQLFPDSFYSLTGHSPMRWQSRLFGEFIDGRIPAALDLPTGLGKTSVMAIWLLARAFANAEALKAIPRRLIYVVDRRAVVDQATEEAEKLRTALEGNAKHLKTRLRLSKSAFPISTLRGAYVDNREWLDDPASPAIVVGTVDMIGSRLLFEGYGVSRKMRPYHAGMLGADTLIILDEAHLVPPFEALLWRIANGVEQFGSCAESDARLVPPFKLLPLSATGRDQPAFDGGAATKVFRLEGEDLSDPIAEDRLSAKKTLNFVKIGDEKNALAEELVRRAWELSEDGGKPIRCLVYCDRRQDAEKVKDEFDKRVGKGAAPGVDTELFVGARRIRERDDAKAWLKKHGFLAGSPAPMRPAFLIATSAGEVGIDLDADHMICDLVPWERMVQRLGRVNRRGQGNATIVVVHGDEPKPKKPDAPTDQELHQAIAFRSLSVLGELPKVETGRDASPGVLRELKLRAEADKALRKKIGEATTPEPLRPALTRALVDAWSMTSLEQHTGRPDVAPWLRGWVEPDNQTMVIWRKYMPLHVDDRERAIFSSKAEINKFFEAAAPHESEKLETESYRVAEWLYKRADALIQRKPSHTTEPTRTEDVPEEGTLLRIRNLQRDDVVALILSSSAEYERHLTLDDLSRERRDKGKDDLPGKLAGRFLVVDARFGGLKDGLLSPETDSEPLTADAPGDWNREAGFRVRQIAAADHESKDKDNDWHFEDDFVLRTSADGDAEEWLVVEHYRGAAQSEDARSVSRPQELGQHQSWAEQKARDIASRIGFSAPATEALAVAALLHDEGKRASRWQRAFRAPHEKGEAGAYKIFAKTRGPINQQILDGYRHEFGSLPYAEAHARFKSLPQEWRDLVLHLIAAHHGQARPAIATRGCEDAPPSALEERAREVALRFARLQKRWGPWGLAWWEALLRAADQQASRENDKRDEADVHASTASSLSTEDA